MSHFTVSADDIIADIYMRAVRLYADNIRPWVECLSEATSSVQIEFDYWVLAPKAVG